jgi:hypothetical protein
MRSPIRARSNRPIAAMTVDTTGHWSAIAGKIEYF